MDECGERERETFEKDCRIFRQKYGSADLNSFRLENEFVILRICSINRS